MNMDYVKHFSGDQVMSFEDRKPMFLWGWRLGSKWVRSIMKTSVFDISINKFPSLPSSAEPLSLLKAVVKQFVSPQRWHFWKYVASVP